MLACESAVIVEALMNIEILIIDDEPMDVEIHRIFLEQRCPQIVVTAFSTPEEAIQALSARATANARKPDLIAIDLYLGVHDGIKLAQQLRASPACAGRPIGILTGSIEPQARRRATAAALDFFVEKPLNSERLAEIGAALKLFNVVQDGRSFRLIDATDALSRDSSSSADERAEPGLGREGAA